MAGSLDWLVKINDWLEGVPSNVIKYFKAITKSGEELTQTQVDVLCAYAAWKVNIAVERRRQAVIKSLLEQHGWMLNMIRKANTVTRVVTDPIGTLGEFVGVFTGPVSKAISWTKTLLTEIPRLAANLAKISSSLPPDPPNPNINFNAFKLEINTISMNDILYGTNMPSPEEMFPRPVKPFSKASFDQSFENAKMAAAEEDIIYKLPSRKVISGGTPNISDIV